MIPSAAAQRHNLPAQSSSFIGRERELGELARLLRASRLVTLTGAGGSGKTRLALRAATAELERFPDGVWLAELAALTTPELVIGTIAKAVAAPEAVAAAPLDGLGAFLGRGRQLLVLDNCEHVLAECARVAARLLARCPNVVLLATSREPLGIAGECVLRVPPLGLPDPSRPVDPDHALDYDGIRFFVERARAAEPSFRLTDVTAPAVADVCRRLDGIPLALELAAVRVRGMGIAYLGARLDDRFRLLTGGDRAAEPRQRTLQTLVDWSYDLLPTPERVVLRRLGVFVGGFSLEAAEIVCAGDYADEHAGQGRSATVAPEAVLESLLHLVDKSLVHFDQDGARYRLLETIRLYAHERLTKAGELDFIGRQHFAWYLAMAEAGLPLLGGPSQNKWFARLEQEHDNLRAALAWAIQAGRGDEAAKLALGLWPFWRAHTYQREGLRWLERIRALDEVTPLPAPLRPQLLNALGALAHKAHHFAQATAYHAEALRLWESAGDQTGMAQAHFDMAWQAFDAVDLDRARRHVAESLALAESVGDKRLIAGALMIGALPDIESARSEATRTAISRSIEMWRELGDKENLAMALAILAGDCRRCGEYEQVKPLLAEAARLHVQLGSYGNRISTLIGLLHQAIRQMHSLELAKDTARILGVVRAYEAVVAAHPSPWWETEKSRSMIEKITRALDPESFEKAVAEGSCLATAEYLALVDRITAPDPHGTAPPSPPAARARAPHHELTARELEVLRLVAQGLTNAQVAERLTVTPRTINAHLTAIYSKLGVTARGGAIRYALEHQLG